MSEYNQAFYQGSQTSKEAAKVILPMVLDLVPVATAVDVGAGNGPWSSVLLELGVSRVLAVDGDYVQPEWLMIPKESFRPVDLTKPLKIGETFDLAMCIEVAEHLEDSRADGLVSDLTQLAPVVLFSAAIPDQGGTGHINEQWQSYWIAKFAAKGYVPIDHIRRETWRRDDVPGIYPQNMFLMVRRDTLASNEKLRSLAESFDPTLTDCVHPYTLRTLRPRLVDQMTLRNLMKETRSRLGKAISKRMGARKS